MPWVPLFYKGDKFNRTVFASMRDEIGWSGQAMVLCCLLFNPPKLDPGL